MLENQLLIVFGHCTQGGLNVPLLVEWEYSVEQGRCCRQYKMVVENVQVWIWKHEHVNQLLVLLTVSGEDLDHGAAVLRHVGEEPAPELEKC